MLFCISCCLKHICIVRDFKYQNICVILHKNRILIYFKFLWEKEHQEDNQNIKCLLILKTTRWNGVFLLPIENVHFHLHMFQTAVEKSWWIRYIPTINISWTSLSIFENSCSVKSMSVQNSLGGGELPNVEYRGMCHQPGSIFHLQKSSTGPKFLKFYSRTGPTFWSFTPEQDPFLTIWSPTPWLKGQKSQLLSSFVSCNLMSPFLFCKVFQAFYNWDQFESGHMYSSLNLTWFHHCG